jgi:hypothetical protein
MAEISFLLSVLLGGTAFLFREAAQAYLTASWAGEVCSTAQIFCHHPEYLAYGGATLLPASETTRKEPEFEPSEKQRDDLNVDAVFAKLKTIGGKKPDQE